MKVIKFIKTMNWISVFLVVFGLIVILASIVTTERKQNNTVLNENIYIQPESVTSVDYETDEYLFHMQGLNEKNNTLLFYTNHLEIEVYADDKLIYSLDSDPSIFGRTPGAMWNIMNLPFDVNELRVVTTKVYANQGIQNIEFQLGSDIVMQRNVVVNSIIDVCVCLAIFLIGLGLLSYWLMVFRRTNEERELLYLGLFALVFGIWAFGETQIAVFMFAKRAFWSYMAFTCLMTVCLPFLLYIREFMETEDKYVHKFIAGYIILETIVAQVLHLTGIVAVKESIMFTLASIIATMLYLFYAIITAMRSGKNRRKIQVNIVGLVALVVTVIADMSGYFTNVSKANQLGKIGFLIYAVILGVETARIAEERVQETRKMEIYREMAEKDMPTGCYNRNAYAEDTSLGMELTGVQLITFDLNNLKVCNDTKGHMAGDKYIADAANMIKEVFAGIGKVYRIGGDEFCILTKNTEEAVILERRQLLKEEIKTYREENNDPGFGIACGYAEYDPSIDKDLEETRHRADLFMYKNKKEIKAVN